MMLVMLVALTLLNPALDWELLGTRRVSFTLDHDAIMVATLAPAEPPAVAPPAARGEEWEHLSSGLFANTQAKTTVHVYGRR